MDRPWWHYTKWNKSEGERYILHDSTCIYTQAYKTKKEHRKQISYEPRDKNWVKKVNSVVRDGNNSGGKDAAVYTQVKTKCCIYETSTKLKINVTSIFYKKILQYKLHKSSLQGSLIALSTVQSLSHVWLCNPMDYSTPGFPVLHYLQNLVNFCL